MAKKQQKREFDENNKDWLELTNWIEEHILEYPKGQHISDKFAVLKLRGLERGQTIATDKQATNGTYSLKAILYTFMRNEKVILKAFYNKPEIEGERSKISYACAIIRDKIYDTQLRIDKAESKTMKLENLQVVESNAASNYKPKENNKKIRHSELW